MDYVIQGTRTDGTIAELFRTGNITEAEHLFAITKKHSYVRIKMLQELKAK